MPGPDVQEGHGATLVFATTGYAPNIVSINTPGVTRAALETTNLGTTGGKIYIPEKLPEFGELSFTVQMNPDALAPVDAPAEAITLTFGDAGAGNSSAADWDFTGFVSEAGPASISTGEILVQDITVKVSGAIIPTPAAV